MALVIPSIKSVYLHIYKTGGTWVKSALDAAGVPNRYEGYQHSDHFHSSEVEPDWPRFVSVRNPYAWYASFWAWRDKEGWGGDLAIGHGDYVQPTFEGFVDAVVEGRPGFLTELYERYDPGGGSVVVLKSETLCSDLLGYLVARGGAADCRAILNCPPANRAGTLDDYRARTLYADRAARRIYEAEMDAFVRYGYSEDNYRRKT